MRIQSLQRNLGILETKTRSVFDHLANMISEKMKYLLQDYSHLHGKSTGEATQKYINKLFDSHKKGRDIQSELLDNAEKLCEIANR
jgi:ribosomal protein L22